MKSAKEWFDESDTHIGFDRCHITTSKIRAIQADAINHAAEVVKRVPASINPKVFRQRIQGWIKQCANNVEQP